MANRTVLPPVCRDERPPDPSRFCLNAIQPSRTGETDADVAEGAGFVCARCAEPVFASAPESVPCTQVGYTEPSNLCVNQATSNAQDHRQDHALGTLAEVESQLHWLIASWPGLPPAVRAG